MQREKKKWLQRRSEGCCHTVLARTNSRPARRRSRHLTHILKQHLNEQFRPNRYQGHHCFVDNVGWRLSAQNIAARGCTSLFFLQITILATIFAGYVSVMIEECPFSAIWATFFSSLISWIWYIAFLHIYILSGVKRCNDKAAANSSVSFIKMISLHFCLSKVWMIYTHKRQLCYI